MEFEPLTSAPGQFSVAVAYESEESQMPAELREAYRAWHAAVTDTDVVSSTLVLAGRRALGREKDPENSEVAQLIRQSLQVRTIHLHPYNILSTSSKLTRTFC